MNAESTAKRSISILGAGAWGTTLAILAAEAGNDVTLVTHSRESADFMTHHRAHPRSLPGITIPRSIIIASVLTPELEFAETVVVALPTQKLRASLLPLRDLVRDRVIVSVVKGLELESILRPTEVIRDVLGDDIRLTALSGPNLAGEVARGLPATAVIASEVPGLADRARTMFHTNRFRVYVSDDVIGVELGGALKNIVAIGAGIADGMNAGDNAKAAFMTRGIAEIARLGVACGAQPLTFAGLSGIGDLIATCSSPLSRNHQVGSALAAGKSISEILESMSEVAEGVPTTKAAVALGRRHKVELPIVEQMHRVLFEGVHPTDAIMRLMERDPRHELLDLAP